MARFKVGDRARIIRALNAPNLVGNECLIVDVVIGFRVNKYEIIIDGIPPFNGYRAFSATDADLEPIIDLGSWGEIEKAVNWNPMKKEESVK